MSKEYNKTILKVKNVSKTFLVRHNFRGKSKNLYLYALDKVQLQIKEGQIVGCVGESGCGKSTLAKTIVFLEPPTSGEILYKEQDIYSFGSKELKTYRRKVQLIFQDPYSSLPFHMQIQTILMEPLIIHRIGTNFSRKERARELLSLVKMKKDDLKYYPHQFSGGQRQRICIARAIAINPEFLICDEPVASLDVSIQSQILNLLRELQIKFNLTYLIISHDLRVIKYMCDYLVVMYLGQIVEKGDAHDIFKQPLHPYTRGLLKSIPSRKINTNRLFIIKGDVPSPIDIPKGCYFQTRCSVKKEICELEKPELRKISENRWVACHFI